MSVMIAVYVAVLGICLGSFVNALVWRLRIRRQALGTDNPDAEIGTEQPSLVDKPGDIVREVLQGVAEELREWLFSPYRALRWLLASSQNSRAQPAKTAATADKYSILTGRSMCPHCEHELAAKDLVPVLSWLTLGGKCRYCRAPISPQYPLIELATGVLFVVFYLLWSQPAGLLGNVLLALWLGVLTGLVALALYDAKYRHLPNEVLYPLLWLGLGIVVLQTFHGGVAAALTALAGVSVIWGLFFTIFCIGLAMNRELIGYGDVRLAVLLGLLCGGALPGMLVIFFASTLGLVWALPSLARGQANGRTSLPYGPFLIVGLLLVALFGDTVIGWYLRLLVG